MLPFLFQGHRKGSMKNQKDRSALFKHWQSSHQKKSDDVEDTFEYARVKDPSVNLKIVNSIARLRRQRTASIDIQEVLSLSQTSRRTSLDMQMKNNYNNKFGLRRETRSDHVMKHAYNILECRYLQVTSRKSRKKRRQYLHSVCKYFQIEKGGGRNFAIL